MSIVPILLKKKQLALLNSLNPTTKAKFLFLWTGKFNGDNLLSDLDNSVITVTGKDFSTTYIPYTSAATFAVPDNATYEGADTDLMWFDGAGTPKTINTSRLSNFDYSRTLIQFDNNSPYHVRKIGILKQGETLTEAEVNEVHRYFKLWLYWSGVLNTSGVIKENRYLTSVPTILSAQIPSAQPTKVAITFDQNIDTVNVPAVSAFTLAGKTISGISISGAVVTLTVTVGYGDETVQVSYTKPVANPLQSAMGGGKVASFTNQVVTNNLYGPNVISNGTFDSDTIWTKNGSVAISDGVGVFNSTPSGNNFSQGAVVTAGKTYLVKYEIVSLSAGGASSSVGGTAGTQYFSTGIKTEIILCGAANDFFIRARGTTTGTIDNVSVKEIL